MQCKNMVVQKDKEGRMFLRPCGQCLSCRINDCRSWYVRSFFEFKKSDRPFQYFLTLTYSDEFLPVDNLCDKKELKKFLNNLNTSFGLHMRYFATSDYGSISGRAHYHAVIATEKKLHAAECERIWKKGFIQLKKLNDNNLKYTLRYTVKKVPFEKGDKTNFRLISKGWGNNVADYYTGQEYFLINGKKYGITRYLADKLKLPKKEVFKTKYYDLLRTSRPDFEKIVENDEHFNEDLTLMRQYMSRISRKEIL